MPDKGKIMSQAFYEKQSKLLKLFRESFEREEMNADETISALKTLGFSKTVAAIRVNEWKTQLGSKLLEAEKDRKRRLKDQASLEKYLLRNRLGKKYKELHSKYSQEELSKKETVKEFIQYGYSRKFSECLVDKWEMEKQKKDKGKTIKSSNK